MIEKSKDANNLKFKELVWNLRTYEANYRDKKKSKGIILNIRTEY